jgi:hypothetical protein
MWKQQVLPIFVKTAEDINGRSRICKESKVHMVTLVYEYVGVARDKCGRCNVTSYL